MFQNVSTAPPNGPPEPSLTHYNVPCETVAAPQNIGTAATRRGHRCHRILPPPPHPDAKRPISRCDMGRFIIRYGPFRAAKRPILHSIVYQRITDVRQYAAIVIAECLPRCGCQTRLPLQHLLGGTVGTLYDIEAGLCHCRHAHAVDGVDTCGCGIGCCHAVDT